MGDIWLQHMDVPVLVDQGRYNSVQTLHAVEKANLKQWMVEVDVGWAWVWFGFMAYRSL